MPSRRFASPRLMLGVGLLLVGMGDLLVINLVLLPRHLAHRTAVSPGRAVQVASPPAEPSPPEAAPSSVAALPPVAAPPPTPPPAEIAPQAEAAVVPPAPPAPILEPQPSAAAAAMPTLPPLRFFRSTTWLSPEAHETLARLATVLKEDPNLQVVLTGHTDKLGPAEFNRLLSLNRARRARHVLVGAGIPRDRIEIHGVGSSQPLDDSPTAQARASNRRVEITLR